MSAVAATPVSPFKGLAAFEDSELDSLFFFGRERERAVLVANLLAARLTVLYGESGVGKSSLLGAGVMRELRALEPGAVVALHDTWSGSIDDALTEVRDVDDAYLILDQFEEYFLYHADDGKPGALLHDLPELLEGSRVNVLVSLREDSLARLDAFKARIPGVFGNQVRLEHLDRDAARSAILGPIARWNELTGESVEIEPRLVEAVLDDVSVGRDVEAPYLQLVLERIWQTERDEGSSVLRLATLLGLGGAATIVRDHLQGALEQLDADEQDVAASMFEHLVTPSGTKIAHRAPDLAEYANVPESALRNVLATLTRDRIVHSVDGSDRYEIFHDVLAEPIRAWRQQRRLERERLAARRRQRRLYVVSAASLVALAVVAGLAVWAFSERGSARAQARHARARELEATALQQLTIDPNRSVQLALTAAKREPGRAAEAVLRDALIQDRLRLVVHTGGEVRAVAISPQGDLVAAAVRGGRVLVADARSGRILHRLFAHGGVSGLGFLDARTLVAVSPHGVATAWRVRTGVHVFRSRRLAAGVQNGEVRFVPIAGRLADTLPHVRQLSVAPGGALTAARVSGPDRRVRVWVFSRDGRLLRILREIGIKDLTFSPNGRRLATASATGSTTIWNPRTGQRRDLRDTGKSVAAVAFNPDGTLLASGGQDSGVRIWTVEGGERRFYFFAHTNPVTTVAWSPDGRVVASASADRTARLWRAHGLVGEGSLAATLAGDTDAVNSLAFSRDGRLLVTGSKDGTARVWDARPDQELRQLGRGAGAAVAARWAGNSVVAAWASGIVRVFDAHTRRLVHRLREASGGGLTSLAASRDGSVVVAGTRDGTALAWDARTGGTLAPAIGIDPVLAVAVSPRGELAASGDKRGGLRLWNPHSGRLRWVAAQGGAVNDIAFSSSGMLATAGPRGAVLWSTTSRPPLHLLPTPAAALRVAFSTDGRLVGVAGADGNTRLWFTATGRPYRTFHGHRRAVTDLAFSANGKLLATSSNDSDGRLWNVTTGRGVHRLVAHFGPVAGVAFSPNGRWVATAGPTSAGLWPVTTGRLLFYLRGQTQPLTSVSFSPDGHTILTSSQDGTVETFSCEVCGELDSLMRVAEQRLARTR
jgi:WD40 repeat protein